MKRNLNNNLIIKNLDLIDLTFLIVIITFFLIGIIIYDDYGISWDEYWHRINGFVSLNFLRELFSLDKYPNLEHVSEFRIQDSKKYGILFDLPMSFIEKIFVIEDSRKIFLLRHFSNFFVFFISTIFFYKLLNKRFSKILSLIGVLFLIFTPRIFAESFYNMKDLIFLSFFIISLYFAVNFLTSMTYKNTFFCSFTSSLLIAIKIIGIIIPFIVLFFFILKTLDNNSFLKKYFFKIILYLFLLITFTIIFWPYLWNDPINNFIDALKSFSSYSWRGSIFYLGEYISALNLPWHYPLAWILITTPILYLILFFLGSFLILKSIWLRFLDLSPKNLKKNIWMNNNEMIDIIVLLIFYFTLFLVIEINATLYNGWRHLYFIYPCLIFISIRGLDLISKKFKLKTSLIIILPFMFYTCFWMIKNHPFQFIYFNKLAGNNVKENFELDYWGVSNKSSLSYIAKNDNKQKIKIYVHSESPYYFSLLLMNKEERQRLEFVKRIDDADYLVTNHYYQRDIPAEQNQKLLKKFSLYKEFKVDDLIINSIYKIN